MRREDNSFRQVSPSRRAYSRMPRTRGETRSATLTVTKFAEPAAPEQGRRGPEHRPAHPNRAEFRTIGLAKGEHGRRHAHLTVLGREPEGPCVVLCVASGGRIEPRASARKTAITAAAQRRSGRCKTIGCSSQPTSFAVTGWAAARPTSVRRAGENIGGGRGPEEASPHGVCG
jgi:hypothetical protein